MAEFFLRFLRSCYRVPNSKVSLTCNLFADHEERQQEIEDFWLESLGLPKTCLRKSTVNRFSKYSQKKATKQAALWHVSPSRLRHAARPAHLWRDPGIRRLRARGMGHV